MNSIHKEKSIGWIIFLVVAGICFTACDKEASKDGYAVDTHRGYHYAPQLPAPLNKILPENQSQPVSFDGAKIVGTLSSNELAEISTTIGRIANIDRRVKSLELAWRECPLALRIEVGGYELFFVKSAQGKWDAVGSAKIIRDYFDSDKGRVNSDKPTNAMNVP